MKPFAAWLAIDGAPPDGNAVFGDRPAAERWSFAAQPQPVLIVPNTEENRRKLGMEEV